MSVELWFQKSITVSSNQYIITDNGVKILSMLPFKKTAGSSLVSVHTLLRIYVCDVVLLSYVQIQYSVWWLLISSVCVFLFLRLWVCLQREVAVDVRIPCVITSIRTDTNLSAVRPADVNSPTNPPRRTNSQWASALTAQPTVSLNHC